MDAESLNVGCGLDPWGDIRVDRAFDFLNWHFRPTVLADAHYLPFKDGSFKVVKASHVLEHLRNPFEAIDEMLRVASTDAHFSFPTELDVFPLIISGLFPYPRFRALSMALHTRGRRLHLWIINPEVIKRYVRSKGWEYTCKKNTWSIFLFFEGGKKARYFNWLTRTFRISFEYSLFLRKISSPVGI